MAKKALPTSTNAAKEIVRVTFRFHGPELEQIREVRDMLSLNSEVDAARYLMLRGLEAITATLTSRRVQGQMQAKVNPEEMIKQMVAMGFGPGDESPAVQIPDQRGRKRK
jgi:hypothetical protein